MDPCRLIYNLALPQSISGDKRSDGSRRSAGSRAVSRSEYGEGAIDAIHPETTASQSGPELAQLGAALPAVLFGIAAISIPLSTAQAFGLTQGQTSAIIFALFGIPGILCLVLARLYRQPVLIAWLTSALVFITALSVQYTYPQVLGGLVVAGILVLMLGALGLSRRISMIIPAPIVFGIVAGTAMPFVVRVLNEMSVYPLLIGTTVVTFVLGQRLLPARVPPILPAVVLGAAMAVVLGEFEGVPDGWTLSAPEFILPSFSWHAVLSIAPVVAVFIALQSNLTTSIYLRRQHYSSPDRLTNILTGGGTSLGAFFGATPISSGSAVIALVAGPDAGEKNRRYWTVYLIGGAWILIAIGASLVATVPSIIPLSLLFALAGIVLFGVLSQALKEITDGPLRLGPLFAFVVASSQLTLLGLGPLFWALVIGLAVTLLLERESYLATRSE